MMKEVANLKSVMEDIIEKWNGYIQGIILLIALYVGLYKGAFKSNEPITILLQIVTLLFIELFLLGVKDSIGQRKLNEMNFNMTTLTQFAPFDPRLLEDFQGLLQEAHEDLFISGITCTNVLEIYESDIENLLGRGIKVRLLISTEEALEYNAGLYFGLYGEDKEKTAEFISEAQGKMATTLRNLAKYENLNRYFCEGKLEIRRSDSPFSIGLVGVNCFSSKSKINKIIKITHYIYGCNNTPSCPRTLVSSFSNDHWYKYYNDFIKKQWDTAKPYAISDCKIYKK